MTTVLQIGDRTLDTQEIIPLLVSYQLIPQFLSESIIDRAIAPISCTLEETDRACQELYQHWRLDSEPQKQAWRLHYGLSQEQFEQLATRKLRIEKFKQATWGHRLESYFLKRKRQLDRAVYSLIRIQDQEIASELFFRIREGEQSFAELAQAYSQGAEVRTGGLVGPVELGTLHPNLAELLLTSSVGKVRPPIRFGAWQVIVRLEQLIPAQLDDQMRQRLLKEKYEAWLQEQLQHLPDYDRIWMGMTPHQPTNAIANRAA